jgi:hypothetical protein
MRNDKLFSPPPKKQKQKQKQCKPFVFLSLINSVYTLFGNIIYSIIFKMCIPSRLDLFRFNSKQNVTLERLKGNLKIYLCMKLKTGVSAKGKVIKHQFK